MLKQFRVFVKGDVIGVGYRAWAAYQARKLGVTGWVRNVFNKEQIFGPEGGVEAMIQAEDRVIDKMLQKLRAGPPVSSVDEIEIKEERLDENLKSFEVLK